MNPNFLLRLARMARKRPSEKQFFIVMGFVALMLLVGGLEWLGWWPDWATSKPGGRRLRP